MSPRFRFRNRASTSPRAPQPQVSENASRRFAHQINRHPRGIGLFAAMFAAHPNFTVLKSFMFLRNRLLILNELELAELEIKLLDLDDKVVQDDPIALMTYDYEGEGENLRALTALTTEIAEKLKEYDDLVSRSKIYYEMEEPNGKALKDFRCWVKKKQPMFEEENDFLIDSDDLLTFKAGDQSGFFDVTIAWFLDFLPQHAVLEKSDDGVLQIRNGARADLLIRTILTLIIAGILVAPAAILLVIKTPKWQVVVVFGFTVAFLFVLNIATQAKRHELFAAAPAYVTVLVVLISSTSSNAP